MIIHIFFVAASEDAPPIPRAITVLCLDYSWIKILLEKTRLKVCGKVLLLIHWRFYMVVALVHVLKQAFSLMSNQGEGTFV